MGTPDFALPSLSSLMRTQDVVAVVTQPDRRVGRKRKLRDSPVKQLARAARIPVLQPRRIRDDQAIDQLRALDADVFVVAAYGQILPQALLDLPRLGCINVHASLLPRWRGAAPIQAAILAGDAGSGVTIMQMDAGLDTGPILSQRPLPLRADETGQSLHDKLALLGADLLIETLPGFLQGGMRLHPQDDALATYAPAIKKAQGNIDWSRPASAIERQVRAYQPWPGSFTSWRGSQIKLHAGYVAAGSAKPGLAIWQNDALAIGCGCGVYVPTELQLAGKKRLAVRDFLNGCDGLVGSVLGS